MTPLSLVASPAQAEVHPEAQGLMINTDIQVDSRTADLVTASLNDRIAFSQARSRDDNLQELTELAKRLEAKSSADSVDSIATQFHSWLGTQARAAMPVADPVPGPFHIDSAQFHELRREATPSGTPARYWAVLIDEQGRLLEVEITAAEGAPLYETMQRLKKFPLAEKLYRQIAMPLLDKLLRENRTSSPAGEVSQGQSDNAHNQPSRATRE